MEATNLAPGTGRRRRPEAQRPGGTREETIRSPEEPIHSEPIFSELAAAWHEAGRCVPGHRDDEWIRLTTGPRFGFRRRQTEGTPSTVSSVLTPLPAPAPPRAPAPEPVPATAVATTGVGFGAFSH